MINITGQAYEKVATINGRKSDKKWNSLSIKSPGINWLNKHVLMESWGSKGHQVHALRAYHHPELD